MNATVCASGDFLNFRSSVQNMDVQKNRILDADTPFLFDAFLDSPKQHIHDDAHRISCSAF